MFSLDAGAFGARLGPSDAYRFAKGEEITASSGQPAKLSRPLDFLVVADHSDNMGFFPGNACRESPSVLADPTGRRWYDMISRAKAPMRRSRSSSPSRRASFPRRSILYPGTAAYRSAWQETIKAAEEANDPGRFTAFIGYEWTSNTGGNNLHRNVIFRDNGDKASQVVPFITMLPLGSDNPRDLWKWMAAYEDKTGGDVLAIAHNGNLSNGRMFPIDRAWHRISRSTASMRRPAPSGSASTRRRRSRAMARRIPSCRPMTNSPISSAGTRAISI